MAMVCVVQMLQSTAELDPVDAEAAYEAAIAAAHRMDLGNTRRDMNLYGVERSSSCESVQLGVDQLALVQAKFDSVASRRRCIRMLDQGLTRCCKRDIDEALKVRLGYMTHRVLSKRGLQGCHEHFTTVWSVLVVRLCRKQRHWRSSGETSSNLIFAPAVQRYVWLPRIRHAPMPSFRDPSRFRGKAPQYFCIFHVATPNRRRQVLQEIDLEQQKLTGLYHALAEACMSKEAVLEFAGKGASCTRWHRVC